MKASVGAAAVIAAAVVAVGASPVRAADDVVRPCAKRVYGPNTPIYITSARNMTCKAAKRAQKKYKWTGENTFTTPGGFRCKPSGRGEIGYQIRCTKRAKAYRIEFEGG